MALLNPELLISVALRLELRPVGVRRPAELVRQRGQQLQVRLRAATQARPSRGRRRRRLPEQRRARREKDSKNRKNSSIVVLLSLKFP